MSPVDPIRFMLHPLDNCDQQLSRPPKSRDFTLRANKQVNVLYVLLTLANGPIDIQNKCQIFLIVKLTQLLLRIIFGG